MKYLAQKIKYFRKRKGLIQRELASALGVEQSTVAGWELGTRTPSTAMLEKLADTLNCSIDELFGRGGEGE